MMIFKNQLLNEYDECKNTLIDSYFDNFLGHKRLFKLIFEAATYLDIQEYKDFCRQINITSHEAKNFYHVYDTFFRPDIADFKITDDIAKKARLWEKNMWIEFSKIYTDEKTCRKTLFCTLISGKLKYNNICIPVENLKLNDIKKFKQYVNKFRTTKNKDISTKFKSLRTRLNNFINKDFKNYTRADKELLETIRNHNANLIALIEEHLENCRTEEDNEYLETENIAEHYDEADDGTEGYEWFKKIRKYTETDIYNMYKNGENLKVNWDNPYYAVIFLGLDVFNLPTAEDYRKRFKELMHLFHPDTKEIQYKPVANRLTTILNDINLNTWGHNGERYIKFLNSIKFSLMQLEV
jgi:hypothetical protein